MNWALWRVQQFRFRVNFLKDPLFARFCWKVHVLKRGHKPSNLTLGVVHVIIYGFLVRSFAFWLLVELDELDVVLIVLGRDCGVGGYSWRFQQIIGGVLFAYFHFS
jgi:sensor histidine kinase YesM